MAGKYSQTLQISQPLDYTQIVFRQINTCREFRKDLDSFFAHVEMLADLLYPYWKDDESFIEQLEGKHIPDFDNPWFKSLSPEKRADYVRKLFRALIELIHRSGFLPLKEIEGVISEYDGKVIEELLKLEKEYGADVPEEKIKEAVEKVNKGKKK